MVRGRGFEPPRPCGHQPLKLACLPFHHPRVIVIILAEVCNITKPPLVGGFDKLFGKNSWGANFF